MKKIFLLLIILLVCLTGCINTTPDTLDEHIYLIVNEEVLTVELYDNVTSNDLLSKLPLTLSFSDFNSSEKIAYLPNNEKLDYENQNGCDPSIGDITLYVPWGNIAIFYKDSSSSRDLVPIGRILDNKIEVLQSITTDFTMTITTEIPKEEKEDINIMYIKVNNTTLEANLVDNSSTRALIEKLKQGDVVIDMTDYGNFEKYGPLGFDLPRNDERISTTAGDLILYQGNLLSIYYSTNTWNFTRLGKIDITQSELLQILGTGNVTVTISLTK